MRSIKSLTSCFKPNRRSQPSDSGTQPADSGTKSADSHPPKSASKKGQPTLGPGLQRSDSNPARLPSNTPERTQVKDKRPKITRSEPDQKKPKHFDRILGIPRPFSTEASSKPAKKKWYHFFMGTTRMGMPHLIAEVKRDPELMEVLKERHPDFQNDPEHKQGPALKHILNHPKFLILEAKLQNEMHRLPSGPTATRKMTPTEQKFLTNASQEISAQSRKNPFHIHGETAVTGTKDGEISRFQYNHGKEIDLKPVEGEKFHLHTHPPFMEPCTSSASLPDHSLAAYLYQKDNNKPLHYVTNGKDILHIRQDSTELTKLIPDPKLGKLPVAFTVPTPEQPPHPFSNHEAPAAFKEWVAPKIETPEIDYLTEVFLRGQNRR